MNNIDKRVQERILAEKRVQATLSTTKPECAVNNPKHYMLFADGTESFDVIRKTLTPEEYIGGLKFNILKYRLRMGKKKGAVDCLKKAQWYENKLAEFCATRNKEQPGKVSREN